MSKINWLKIVQKMEKEIVAEVVESLKKATGCQIPEGEGPDDILYLNKDRRMFWKRDSEGTLIESFHSGDTIILFKHKPEEMGCYGCEVEECLQFDQNPGFTAEEIDDQIKMKMDEILGTIYINVPE